MDLLSQSGFQATIAKLDPHLVNQIAAGEVVERPASVIKELVENSLDAGAGRIDILLESGGLQSITVVDDGRGMNPLDLPLALDPHATSKIQSSEDLESIETFGFRGEALASIASVAHVSLLSRIEEMPSAFLLESDFGERKPLRPAAGPRGTRIEVRDLFQRIPARLKYLRSSATEFSHCSRLVREIALGNPGTSFFLFHEKRQIASYVGKSQSERFKECFRVTWQPFFLEEHTDDMALSALLSPATHVQNKGELFLFLNGRPVKNRILLAAVRQAYLEALGPGHEPSGAIYLRIRADWVDVNVHPQKWEVRCLRQERLYQWLVSLLRKRLSENKPTSPLPSWNGERNSFSGGSFSGGANYHLPASQFQTDPHGEVETSLRYLGGWRSDYLLCEDSEGLLILDPHACDEWRIQNAWNENKAEMVKFSSPQILSFSVNHLNHIPQLIEQLGNLGIEVAIFGDNSLSLQNYPAVLDGSRFAEGLKAILTHRVKPSSPAELLSLLACHSAIPIAHKLSGPEIMALLAEVDVEKLPKEPRCPHGRPVSFRLSYETIKKHFERT